MIQKTGKDIYDYAFSFWANTSGNGKITSINSKEMVQIDMKKRCLLTFYYANEIKNLCNIHLVHVCLLCIQILYTFKPRFQLLANSEIAVSQDLNS